MQCKSGPVCANRTRIGTIIFSGSIELNRLACQMNCFKDEPELGRIAIFPHVMLAWMALMLNSVWSRAAVTEPARSLRPHMTFLFLVFAGLFLVPVALSTVFHFKRDRILDWRNADRSSAGLLPPPIPEVGAVVRIFSARTVRWRGIVATHSWVVVKEAGAAKYSRFDYTAWGEPIWIDRFVPDGRWFGRAPEVVFAADGGEAERMIPLIRQAVRQYAYPNIGDYRVWPGPNSNTFVAAIIAAVPDMHAALPSTAIGKDFPFDRRWIGWTPSHTGIRVNLGGYLGFSIGWVEGLEINVLGAVAGIDMRRPALKLPGIGRLGMLTAVAPQPNSVTARSP
jgi:hypothetical protein